MFLKEKTKRKREREREPHEEVKPPNLMIIALFGISPFACILEVVFTLQTCTCK